MELTIRISGDTKPAKLLLLAEAIRTLAGEKSSCAGTCSHVDGELRGIQLDHVSVGYRAEHVSNGTAIAQDDIPETAGNVTVAIAGQPVSGYAPDTIAEQACFNCGFYGCRCDALDAEVAQEQLDTAAIFGGGIDGAGKHPAENLDTAAIFGGNSAAPAPCTAGAVPSTTAPTLPNAATSHTAPGAPTSAATADSQASAAPTAANTVNLAGVELDVNGLPWDARIHARTKAKVGDGSWRVKRGVDATVMAQVIAELKAAAGAPAAPVTTPTTPPPVAAGTGTPPPPGSAIGPFPQLMRDLSRFIVTEENPNNRISQSGLRQFAAQLGLVNQQNQGEVAMLMQRPDLITAFRALVNAHLAQWSEYLEG